MPSQAIDQIRQRGAASGRRGFGAALSGRGANLFAYDAASFDSQDFGDWFPTTRSPDSEINPNRDRIAARARDLYRNDAWAKGAIGRILDSTIGASYRPVSKPDYRALALHNRAFDAVWADEYRRAAEALWRNYAEDLGRWNDVGRRLTVSQQFRLALGHKLVDGESLIVAQWRPDRIGEAGARYATCFQGIDPDRLSNPFQAPDTRHLRGGVELDDDEAPIAYHLRRAHQFDTYNAVESMTWARVVREDPDDGWRRVYHDCDPDRFGQTRGLSIFAPVLGRLKMLAKFYGLKLQAENVATAFGMYVTSPFDRDMVQAALDDPDDEEKAWSWYQGMRSGFHEDRQLSVSGVRLATLAPGEKIETVAPGGNTGEFSPFTHEMLRGVGQVLGLSGEQVTNDSSDSSWSAARAGIVEAEKTFLRREHEFQTNTATPMWATWMEEPFARGELPLPRRAPSFAEMRTAYARCRWLGTPRGWVDPVSERQGEVLGMAAGFSTLESACARQGNDWEENLEQRGVEMRRMKKLGLPMPQWMNGSGDTATEAAAKPETQEA
ncbi:phage portal protein [Sphingomonas bacterium]|uniref:phage portal protein n=1 Tax=Sphingomonas bacterium TaxID=1895847 RepID=UPI001C2CEBBA|nr:phage portal protein [Sphingomonas bacterium]